MIWSRYVLSRFAVALGLVVLGFATTATAQTNWTGTVGSDWDNPDNWSAGVPTSAVDANVDSATNNPILNANGVAKNLFLGKTSAAQLTVPGSELTVSQIYLGEATGTTSTITQSGGTLTVNGYLWGGSTGNHGADPTKTGSGNYTMTDGTLNAKNFDFGQLGTCTFQQSGGVVNVGFIALGDNYYRNLAGIPASPGQATYILEGDGVLNVPGGMSTAGAGQAYVGLAGGYATLTVQDSAVFHAQLLSVDSGGAAVGEINLHGSGQIILSDALCLSGGSAANGTLNQDGGMITVPTLDGGPGTSAYNFTGGTLNTSNVQNMDLANGGGRLNVGGVGAVATIDMSYFDNIALGKTATQSTDVAPAAAGVNGVFSDYTHTNNTEPNAWWKVDLTGGGTTAVSNVLLTGRDGYTFFLSNFYLRVLGDDGATVLWQDKFITDTSEILADREKLQIELPDGVEGRYVQVQLDGQNLDPYGYGWGKYLSFAECEVGDFDVHDYSQNADSTLGIELDPTNDLCDKLVVGTLTLDGTLDVTSLGGSFSAGQVFDVLDWDTLVGTFDTVNLPALAGGLAWDASNLYVTGQLTVVPEPACGVLLFVLSGAIVSVRRRGR